MRAEIGKRLKLIRKQKRITQAELGEKLGIQFQHVSKYERGETVPTWENLIKLAQFFDVNINWLLTGNGKMFLSPLPYSMETGGALSLVHDGDSDSQLEEIIEALRNDSELKDLIYDYIQNYKKLQITTSRLQGKIDLMKQKL